MIKVKIADWNAKPWAGKHVVVRAPHGPFDSSARVGTLTGYTEKDGYAVTVRVAFEPADWADYPVEDVDVA